ncbi:MAG TPA: hypothetical protein PL044_07830 [Clostridiales bacterium]|nr:MAG: hypothetical protein BWY37_00642 [Firmicutes bacterium ADurb.Bin262]HQH62558.1 hypothetical protein [Clostridiales bacterium]HQK73661.1 hypothetical protein [Clostridiales bacterium]
MKPFPISFWSNIGMKDLVPDAPAMWRDLGITLAMSPGYGPDDKNELKALLDGSARLGIRVILRDYRTHWRKLTELGEDGYRALFAEALADFGSHPAVYGFFTGDEPDAKSAADAFRAMKIQGEMAPHLVAYLNLLPWFDWIAPRIGAKSLVEYLDRVVEEGNAKLLSYDCYVQMQAEFDGRDSYFENLRGYYLATKKHGVPFMNIALSCGHYRYKCPDKYELQWQLCTSVAHGAGAVSWYVIQLPGISDNYRNAPINQFGERTPAFYEMSEVNRIFNSHCGQIISGLKIDECYHVGRAFGGMPLFEPFGNVAEVESNDDVPLIFSRFRDAEGRTYYIVCCNSATETTYVSITMRPGVSLERCVFGNRFVKIGNHSDPVGAKEVRRGETAGIWLSPGYLALLREVNEVG